MDRCRVDAVAALPAPAPAAAYDAAARASDPDAAAAVPASGAESVAAAVDHSAARAGFKAASAAVGEEPVDSLLRDEAERIAAVDGGCGELCRKVEPSQESLGESKNGGSVHWWN